MRKLHFIFILTMAAVIAGCTVYKDKEYEPIDDNGCTIIEADIESLLIGDDSRVWPDGAAIGVYGSELGENEMYTIKDAGVGLNSASFYGPVVKGNISAYYPYSESYIASYESMPVMLSADQEFDRDASALQQYMKYTPRAYGYQTDSMIKFVYPNGLLKVLVDFQETLLVENITVSSDSLKLAGLGVFKSDAELEMAANASGSVTLDCGEGVYSKSEGTAQEFYLVVLPGVYDDLTLTIGIANEEPFICALPSLTIERIDDSELRMVSVKLQSSGPAGFDEDTSVKFEE